MGGWIDAVNRKCYATIDSRKTYANIGNLFSWIFGKKPEEFKEEIWKLYIENTPVVEEVIMPDIKYEIIKKIAVLLSLAEGSLVAKDYPKYLRGEAYMNEERYFDGVAEKFYINGYQVCEKWLKDRREWELLVEDIVHYGKVVSALGETIRAMGKLDKVIDVNGGWAMK